MKWLYPRPETTAAVATLSLLCSLLARALLPPRLRADSRFDVVGASAATYVALRLESHKGYGKRFKHAVLDWFEGDVDDAQTWMLGTIAGGISLVGLRLVERMTGRR